MSIEERMSKCIVYNLTILQHAIKPNDVLEEVLTEGLFIKNNTKAFIQVTYYLFNILDQKEFKKKFYWPIIDKRTESSYRTNAVEFINMLIDRYNISQEKIKLVSVVHSSGKKFMSLILDLITLSIKEVMKRKKIDAGISMDIDKAGQLVDTISEIENDIIGSMKTDLKAIKDLTNEVQELINIIYPSEEHNIPFEEFIENWHALNKTRFEKMKENNAKIKEVITKSKKLQEKAQRMLSKKEYKVLQPSTNQIKELGEFYQQIDLPVDEQLNIVSLLFYLESSISIIQNYIKNYSFDEVEISQEEMEIVKRKLVELQHFEPLLKKLTERERELREKIEKISREKEEHELSMVTDDSKTLHDEKLLKEIQERESMSTLLSPKYHFDASKNSMNCVMIKKNHLVFATDNDGKGSTEHSMNVLNHTKLYRPLSDSKLNKSREVGPPKQNNPPSRRRRRDPMQLLEQAISSTNRKYDLNSTTQYGGTNLATSTPFSSTMLSPDLIHHPNFSMISNISSVCQTPLSSIGHNHINKVVAENFHMQQFTQFQSISKPDVLSVNNIENIPCNGEQRMKNIQISPVMKTDQMVALEEAFKNVHIVENHNSSIVPKIQVIDDSLSTSNSTNENTVYEKENFGCGIDFDTIILKKKQGCEESLFNVSDTILDNVLDDD